MDKEDLLNFYYKNKFNHNKRISKVRYKDNLKSVKIIIYHYLEKKKKNWIERRLIVKRYIRMIINTYQHNKKESA